MKTLLRIALVTLAAAATIGATKPAPRAALPAAAAKGNWTASVVRTPGNAILVGNPAALAKLVEYFSYTCPHCAHFEEEAGGELSLGFIRTGKGSMEYRPFMRNAVDVAATLIATCGAPAKFPGNHAMLMRQQSKWMVQVSEAQMKRWGTGTFAARMQAIASDFKFYDMFAARGYDRITLNRCLANEALAQSWIAENEAAKEVEGTPTFYLNGRKQYVNTWEGLRPILMDATR
jgi:protein-disulfide isomerase